MNNGCKTLAEDSGPLEVLMENTPDAVYFKDRESRFVHFSKSFLDIFHVSDPETIRGKTDMDFFQEAHARPAFEDEQEIIRSGQPMIGKLEREIRTDGRVTWALTTKMPWRNKQGEIIGTFGISKDVTALIEAEEKLAREQELLRTLLNNVPDRIYFKDRESRFVHLSRSFLAFHSASLEDVKGKTDADLFTPEHARPALEDEQRIIRTGEPIIGKLEKETHPDGRVTWALTSKMPWRDAQGNTIGTFGISKDVTAIQKAEADLEAAHKRLLETSRLAGMAEVATDVLHNVGNTLNSINVCCSLVIDSLKQWNLHNLSKVPPMLQEHAGHLDDFLSKDPKGKLIPEYLASVPQRFDSQKVALLEELEQLRHHINHVNQIVAMQQSYAKVAGAEEQVEVAQLIDDALHINAAALDRHAIQMTRDYEPLPPILVDKHKVLQILINLIRNAKYAVSEANRDDRRLLVRAFSRGEQVHIEVIDNGVGIPAENLTRIFGHGFTTRRDGHGFGLHSGALAARELGGSLVAKSDGVGKGATFTLILPIKRPTPAASA